jgi:hypothetical protein
MAGGARVSDVLDRLSGVRKCGRGWIAKCPAHQDRSASLSVSQTADGRWLMHCFAGCAIGDVLAAIGLTINDLFPRRLPDRNMTPEQRRELREHGKQAQWRAALNAIGSDLEFVLVCAAAAARGEMLPETVAALDAATARIAAARHELARR